MSGSEIIILEASSKLDFDLPWLGFFCLRQANRKHPVLRFGRYLALIHIVTQLKLAIITLETELPAENGAPVDHSRLCL